MDKLKVYEAAAKLKLSSDALVKLLKNLGIKVKGYSAYISKSQFDRVKAYLDQEKASLYEKLKKKEPRRKRKKKKPFITPEKVEESFKQTITRMESKRKKKKYYKEKKHHEVTEEKEKKEVKVYPFMTVADLSHLLQISPAEVIKKCLEGGLMVTINQRLDADTIQWLVDEFGYTPILEEEVEEEEEIKDEEPKPPVVTIMGHVDHGKTTLLDYIRKTNVAGKESGGITQHIGAYKVNFKNNTIVFLDTPGHEAFTTMRARGAQVTDIVVLVVAADDGVMPQTLEAVDHARAAGVPIIVAITKIDKPEAKPDMVKSQLAEHGILVEEYGGNYLCVELSGKTGEGVDDLLDAILLKTMEIQPKSTSRGKARGIIIEAKNEKGRGNVITVLIQRGTLRKGDYFFAGEVYGRVREMFDENMNKIQEAGPATPVQILGASGLPELGEKFEVTDTEREAREEANRRALLKRERSLFIKRELSLQNIQDSIMKGNIKEIKVILKGDVSGTVEALKEAIESLSIDEVKVSVIHSGVGNVSRSDVMLAKASGAIVIGFRTKVLQDAKALANREGIEIRLYDVIYNCLDDIKAAMMGMLEPEYREVETGKVEVRAVFKIPKIGKVAGCYVLEGKVIKENGIGKLIRKGEELYKSEIESLKRFQEDVSVVEQGLECGIKLKDVEDYKVGDIIVVYVKEEIKREI